MIGFRWPRWRRWCEVRFRWRFGWWCEHNTMSQWGPIGYGFYQMRQCTSCGITELR